MKRLALLADGIFPEIIGGMQRHSAHLLRYLTRNGVEVDAYYLSDHPSRPERFDADPLRTRLFPVAPPPEAKFPGHYVWEQYKFSKALFTELLKHDLPPVLYIQGFCGWYLLNHRSSLPQGTRCIVNFHGLEMFQLAADTRSRLQQYMLRPFVRRNLRKADAVISNGGHQTSILLKQGVKPERIITLPIAIEKKWIREGAISLGKPRVFLFIGRNERRRGIPELHDALRRLLAKRTDFLFRFVCPIPEPERIQHACVQYMPRLSDQELVDTIDRSDVLVNPTFAEGMSYVNLECMARGVSVISSDVGAVNMSVNEDNGWLVEPARVDVLVRAMEEALDISEDKLMARKVKARADVSKKFIWEDIITEVIKELVN